MDRMSLPSSYRKQPIAALICAVTLLVVGSLFAASPREQQDFEAASKALRDGFWQRAESELGAFLASYPESDSRAEALLLQAEARYHLTNSTGVVSLLSTNLDRAGALADEYQFWIAEARFQASNFTAAAASYEKLVNVYTNSSRRLEACIGEAAAWKQLGNWPRLIKLLSAPDGVFAAAVQSEPNSEPVVRGTLLLGEAYLQQKEYGLAESTLAKLDGRDLSAALAWQFRHLQCQVFLADNRLEEALQSSSNLVAAAMMAAPNSREPMLANSILIQARILEKTNRFDAAVASLRVNLTNAVPVEQLRESLLMTAELLLTQGKTAEARQTLETFLGKHAGSPAGDVALLTLGELELKEGITTAATNTELASVILTNAGNRFDTLTNQFPQSSLVGKALLDKGWVLWTNRQQFAASEAAFRAAAEKLPLSLDQAVARFKWADAQMAQTNFAGALTNYHYLISRYASVPEVKRRLLERALYQAASAANQAGNLDAAEAAVRKILDWYPDGFLGNESLMFVGQGMVQKGDPARAQKLFEEFIRLKPDSSLVPEIELAIARSYEQQGDWTSAIQQYDGWLANPSNRVHRAEAEFYRAWDNYRSGAETNALTAFTNFVARFPTNELAPMAQRWIADHYFRQGEYVTAEKNYKTLFQTWPKSDLALGAYLMAGRSAVGWQNYSGAIEYFTNITSRLDCSAELKVQALFDYGGALTQLGTQDTNSLQTNYLNAIKVFNSVCQVNSANNSCAQALGEIANCYLQLGALDPSYYDAATNYYWQAVLSPYASVATRSQAEIGFAQVQEKQAQRKTGDARTALLKSALNHYLNVAYATNLSGNEARDLFWSRKACLEAIRLMISLREWDQAERFCDNTIQQIWPPMVADAKNKVARAKEQANGVAK